MRVANSTLTHERGINPRQLVIHLQLVDELLRVGLEEGAWDDERLRPRLAQAAVEVRLFQLANWRSLSRLAHGRELGAEGSVGSRQALHLPDCRRVSVGHGRNGRRQMRGFDDPVRGELQGARERLDELTDIQRPRVRNDGPSGLR